MTKKSVAVILPCHNESHAIAEVVAEFQASLPDADIYVLDNNSTDGTAEIAREAGATVKHVSQQGKGHVVRHALSKIDADIYVMADGDGTYEATRAHDLVEHLVINDLDMVVGVRGHDDARSYRSGHVVGNRAFTKLVQVLFSNGIADLFSGYRVFSRPFAKSFPALATGFEIEAEMSIHAAQLKLPVGEIVTQYSPRKSGSHSKLNTYRDGFRILLFTLRLLKITRPLFLLTALSSVVALASLVLGTSVAIEFFRTGLVPRFPTAIAAATLMIIAVVGFLTGLMLDNLAYAQKEQKRLFYLATRQKSSD